MLDQLLSVSFATGTGFGTEIDEVVRVVIPGTHDFMLGIVEQWHELFEESSAPF